MTAPAKTQATDSLKELRGLRERLRDVAQAELSGALADEARVATSLRGAERVVVEARAALDGALQGISGESAVDFQGHARFAGRRRTEVENALRAYSEVAARLATAGAEVARRRAVLGEAQVELEVVDRALERAEAEARREATRRGELELEEINDARGRR